MLSCFNLPAKNEMLKLEAWHSYTHPNGTVFILQTEKFDIVTDYRG